MTTKPKKDQPAPQEGFRIDSRIDAATQRAPAASSENFCPQAIFTLHCPSSLDYRAIYRFLVTSEGYQTLFQLSFGMKLPTEGGHYGPEQNQGP